MNKRIKKKKVKQEQEVIRDILFKLRTNEQAFETLANSVQAVCDSVKAYVLDPQFIKERGGRWQQR